MVPTPLFEGGKRKVGFVALVHGSTEESVLFLLSPLCFREKPQWREKRAS